MPTAKIGRTYAMFNPSILDAYGCAAWHDMFRRNGDTERCLLIQEHVKNLPAHGRSIIKKLNYYVPIK